MFGGVLGSLKIPVVADLKQFEEGIAKAELQAKAGGGGIGGALKGGMFPAMIGIAAGIGIATLAIKSMIDISDKWETSQKGLAQATDSIRGNYEGARREVDAFIQTNKKFIGSQSEVVDAYAALLRQGLGTKKAQDDLNLALDLSVVGHKSLTEATTLLQQAEMGRGRALLPLGIQMKEFPVLTESQHQADVKLEAAEKGVEKATLAHTAALKAHGPHSAQAQASAKLLADANVKLAEAHSYATERAKASAAVHDLLHQKLDGGRKTTSDLKQATQELGSSWQTFSQTHGPAFLKIFTTAVEILGKVADAIGVVLARSLDLQNAIGKIGQGTPTTPPTSNPARPAGFGRGGVIKGATGFEGTVSQPTMFLAGEGSGPEHVSITPQGHGGGGGVTVVQHIYGNLMTERQTLLWARDGIRRLDRAQA